MSTQISEAFVKQFQADVHLAYQQTGSKLKNMVRSQNNVKGSSTVFQKVGKGVASGKARHGLVPVMSLDHTPVECELQDYYAGDWVDALDELKINHDEKQVIVNAGAYALGRKTDELIINALASASAANDVGSYDKAMTKETLLSAFAKLNGQQCSRRRPAFCRGRAVAVECPVEYSGVFKFRLCRREYAVPERFREQALARH